MGNKTRSVKYARLFDVVCSGDEEREEKAGRGGDLYYIGVYLVPYLHAVPDYLYLYLLSPLGR